MMALSINVAYPVTYLPTIFAFSLSRSDLSTKKENIFRLLQTIGAPMSLRKFPSGACVLQLNSHQDEEVAKTTCELVILIIIISTY